MFMPASELHHSYFQILVWRVIDKDANQEIQEHFAECYISFHKLFDLDVEAK